MTDEELDPRQGYDAPAGGVVVPRSGPVDDPYAPGRFVLPPICVRDGCPDALDDEVVLSRWFVPRGKDFPSEVVGMYDKGGTPRRGPIARSSWYLLLTPRYVRVLAVLTAEASLLVDGAWSPPPGDGWLTFAFDLRDVTYFSGSRRKVDFGGRLWGFNATALMPATPLDRGWATPEMRSRTPDFALELGRAILQAKRDSGDADQEGAADAQARTDWESRVVGRLRTGEMSFPPPAS